MGTAEENNPAVCVVAPNANKQKWLQWAQQKRTIQLSVWSLQMLNKQSQPTHIFLFEICTRIGPSTPGVVLDREPHGWSREVGYYWRMKPGENNRKLQLGNLLRHKEHEKNNLTKRKSRDWDIPQNWGVRYR